MMNNIPTLTPSSRKSWITDWRITRSQCIENYTSRNSSFIANLLPEIAVKLDVFQVLEIIKKRIGTETLVRAIHPEQQISSPASHHTDSQWLKKSNMVGVNVRTIHNFWNIVKYALTLPESHDSIHLLPIWEPGVVGSLYGTVSWKINDEFFSYELARAIPSLDTVEKQLKVVVNLLHALGKTVGLDVIPHTDRFSEMVITHPRLFEWVKREGAVITNHSEYLWQDVEAAIWQFLHQHGSADGSWLDFDPSILFDPSSPHLSDERRQSIIFGHVSNQQHRLRRRIDLIQHLLYCGFETLPMTMAPPYRGLHINPEQFVLDDNGTRWYQYDFDKPEAMSRVFGPLTRFRFFHSKNNNQDWEIDFEKPIHTTWDYFCKKYLECQTAFNFDFMRGDMAHVQMRPDGVPAEPNEFYDPLLAVKKHIQKNITPHFAFYAETFLAPPNTMGYGDELDHLEAIEADATLGDLQAAVVGSEIFMQRFTDYTTWLHTRQFAPSFTVITADKDDPRFDEFYRTGNMVRYFIALFLTDMPSYYSLGFEVRTQNLKRAKNESYSKLYVFKIHDDAETDKVTHGPFEWGINVAQFAAVTRLRLFVEGIWKDIEKQSSEWLVAPTASDQNTLIAWTLDKNKEYVFVANLSPQETVIVPPALSNLSIEAILFDSHAVTESQILPPRLLPEQTLVLKIR